MARGGGVEFEQELSFSGLHQVLSPLLHRLAELDEPHRAALGAALGLGDVVAPDRRVISTAAVALVRVAAAAEPLLLVVDDVQWLDAASSAVLGFVGRRLAGMRAGMLAACRPDEAATLRFAIGSAHEVLPLDPTAAAALLARRLPSLPEWTRGRILNEAQGYPLALLELPTGREQRRRESDDGLAAALPLSARLQELFRARVADLPDATRRLLLLAALDGTGELRVLESATQGRGLVDLEPAEHGRLVHIDPDSSRLRFRHPLTRAAIVEFATLQERREVHRLIAGMVTDNPERQARHLADAANGPDEAVAVRLEDAGRRMARRGDGHGAVAVMVRAAALSQETAGRSRRLAEAAFVGVNLTWDLAQAAELLADARRAAPEIVSPLPAVAATAFLYLNGDGDVDAALRLLVDAVERLSGELDATDEDVVALLSQLHLADRLTAIRPATVAVAATMNRAHRGPDRAASTSPDATGPSDTAPPSDRGRSGDPPRPGQRGENELGAGPLGEHGPAQGRPGEVGDPQRARARPAQRQGPDADQDRTSG